MRLKDASVSFDGAGAPILHALAVADAIYLRIARHDVVVTSCRDGKHSDGSFHYQGLAVDLRTRDVTPDERILILARLRAELPAPYEIIDEGTHFHIEFDQKG